MDKRKLAKRRKIRIKRQRELGYEEPTPEECKTQFEINSIAIHIVDANKMV